MSSERVAGGTPLELRCAAAAAEALATVCSGPLAKALAIQHQVTAAQRRWAEDFRQWRIHVCGCAFLVRLICCGLLLPFGDSRKPSLLKVLNCAHVPPLRWQGHNLLVLVYFFCNHNIRKDELHKLPLRNKDVLLVG